MLEAFAVSTGVVALGEIGDKTQLLALVLAARYRAPWPIIAGIFVATLANHAGASALGTWLTRVVDPDWMRWGLGLSFLAVAAWMLVPDRHEQREEERPGRFGVFGLTTVAFFVVEMGDKTQMSSVGAPPGQAQGAGGRTGTIGDAGDRGLANEAESAGTWQAPRGFTQRRRRAGESHRACGWGDDVGDGERWREARQHERAAGTAKRNARRAVGAWPTTRTVPLDGLAVTALLTYSNAPMSQAI